MALPPWHIVLSIAAILIVAILGFFTGGYLYKKPDLPTAVPSKPSAPAQIQPISGKIYTISPPSTGVMSNTRPVTFESIKDGKAIFFMSGGDVNDIRVDNNVLAYNHDGKLMVDVIGKITSIIDESSTAQDIKKKITVTFYGVEAQKFSLIKSGEIVLKKETPQSIPRLPLTALVFDKDQKPFYWEIDTLQGSNTTARLKSAQDVVKTDQFFVPHLEFGKSNLFILNPDEKLKDGAAIQTTKILYKASPLTKDEVLVKKIRQDIDAKNDEIRNDAFYSKEGELTPDYNNPENAGCPTPTMSVAQASDEMVKDDDAPPAPIFTPACGIPEDAGLPLLERP